MRSIEATTGWPDSRKDKDPRMETNCLDTSSRLEENNKNMEKTD